MFKLGVRALRNTLVVPTSNTYCGVWAFFPIYLAKDVQINLSKPWTVHKSTKYTFRGQIHYIQKDRSICVPKTARQ